MVALPAVGRMTKQELWHRRLMNTNYDKLHQTSQLQIPGFPAMPRYFPALVPFDSPDDPSPVPFACSHLCRCLFESIYRAPSYIPLDCCHPLRRSCVCHFAPN